MDPITQKIISHTKTPSGTTLSDVFDIYGWLGSSNSDSATGIHTSNSTVDMTEGGMVMGKRGDATTDWYVADTVTSPLDGSQGDPTAGEARWDGHPSDAPVETAWTVPAGVTSICILCVGGGAGADGGNSGGGGGLTWINDVPVTPGTQLAVRQGKTGGRNGSGNPGGSDIDGENSYVNDASGNFIIIAKGGKKDQNYSGGSGGDDVNNIGAAYQSLTYGGNRGGHGDHHPSGTGGKGGGGGAAGYSGHGGDGASSCNTGEDGEGGGGGGGGGHCSTDGGQGGGVGIFGEGTSGAGGAPANYAHPGQGGSGGGAGSQQYGYWTTTTGAFGGGCGAGSGGAGRGAVRILWGTGRAFPSTNVGETVTYTHADYMSFNNLDKLHTSMSRGIKQWTETGWVWEGCDPDTGLNIMHQSNRNLIYHFRKYRKFFTIVEYTGNGSTQLIPHDLGCEPSMMWIKNVQDDSTYWNVYHAQLDATNPEAYQLRLSDDSDRTGSATIWNNTKPTDSHFSIGDIGAGSGGVNDSGKKYIAYLFASDQPILGDNHTEVVAKTGTYDGTSGVQTINLGWEPQMVMIKCITNGTPRNWIIMDKVRTMSMASGSSQGVDYAQYINLPGTQDDGNSFIDFTPEGFQFNNQVSGNNWNGSGQTYIYYAVRNDMITTPKAASEVYTTAKGTGTYPSFLNTGFTNVDAAWRKQTNTNGTPWNVGFRKSGEYDMKWNSASTNEGVYNDFKWFNSDGWDWGTKGTDHQAWMFKRAKGFFDVQYWDGNTTDRMIDHQLGVVPELAIVKTRNAGSDGWYVYHKDMPAGSYMRVQSNDDYGSGANVWTAQAPTSTQFPVGTDGAVNWTSRYYIGQFWASLPGVSKVGSYDVNNNSDSVTVDCGFTAGPRFILIKRCELNGVGNGSGGDWLLFDTVRGIENTSSSIGDAEFITAGSYTWTCPAGVTSVCAVAIGGGGGNRGGGGGGLGWKNNISVTPGQTYNIVVGGAGATNNGGDSYFIDATTVCGKGGLKSINESADGGDFVGDGGGKGGPGSMFTHGDNGGGGGAGGYSGPGGAGGAWLAPTGTAGQGGGGGGGAGYSSSGTQGAGGGGVGIYGEGASGGSASGNSGDRVGKGGSGGYDGGDSTGGWWGKQGGVYGGGGGTWVSGGYQDQSGREGAVRLVWSVDGTPVAFPSTNVQQQSAGHDAVLELNKDMPSVQDTNYIQKTNSGFIVQHNTSVTTANAKYIYLAIA